MDNEVMSRGPEWLMRHHVRSGWEIQVGLVLINKTDCEMDTKLIEYD